MKVSDHEVYLKTGTKIGACRSGGTFGQTAWHNRGQAIHNFKEVNIQKPETNNVKLSHFYRRIRTSSHCMTITWVTIIWCRILYSTMIAPFRQHSKQYEVWKLLTDMKERNIIEERLLLSATDRGHH